MSGKDRPRSETVASLFALDFPDAEALAMPAPGRAGDVPEHGLRFADPAPSRHDRIETSDPAPATDIAKLVPGDQRPSAEPAVGAAHSTWSSLLAFEKIFSHAHGGGEPALGTRDSSRHGADRDRIETDFRPQLHFVAPDLSSEIRSAETGQALSDAPDGPATDFLPPEQTDAGDTINGKPVWDLDQIYEQFFIQTQGDGNDWETLPLSYSFPVAIPPGYLDGSGDPVDEGVGFHPFFIEQRTAVVSIMDVLGDLIAPEFTDGGDNGDSVFRFANTARPEGSSGVARASGPWQDEARRGDVWVYSEVASNFDLGLGGDGLDILRHEIGHILGLSHPGAYDTGDGADYDTHAEYFQDSEQYTIMSYFDASKTGAAPYTGEPDTFLLHDLYALQRRYGAELNTRTEDTTYGFNATTGSSTIAQQVYNFDFNHSPRFTIWDAGGDDTIDASGFKTPSEIDLRPGSFSSIGSKVSGGIDIPQGERMVRVQIEIASDLLAENQENFSLRLTGIPGDLEVGNLFGPVARGEIWSQITPLPLISASDAAVEEGEDLTFIVSLDRVAAADVTVDWELRFDSASAADLAPGAPLTGTLTIPGGDTEAEISVATAIDGLTEGYEALELRLFNPSSNAALAVDLTRPLGHIGDAGVPAPHSISISDARGIEPAYVDGSETDVLEFVVTLNRAYDTDLEFDYTVVLDTTRWADFADLRTLNNNISIAYDSAVDGTSHPGFEKSLVWIENAIGGAGDDEIHGNEAGNILRGNGGDDTFFGEGGTDLVFGGDGDDYADGGAGIDILTGEAGNDTLLGGDDADVLYGGDDDDRLSGGDGGDYLSGGDGDDWMTGGVGDDTFYGGAGSDTVDFSYSSLDWIIDLTAGTATIGVGVETLSSIEAVTLDEGDDTVTLSDSDNFVLTTKGDDAVIALGLGTDTINTGLGTDHLSYELMDRRVRVDLGVTDLQFVMFDVGGSIQNLIIGVEHLTGTAFDDELTGNVADNHLFGLAGDDLLEGVTGGNLLDGGQGDDLIRSGDGNDSVVGGSGIDLLSFVYSDAGVEAALWQETATGSWIGTDTWTEIEGLIGSEHEDSLEGWDVSDTIYGGMGRDQIWNLHGDDTTYGGDGGDSIWLDLGFPVPQSDSGPQGDDLGYGGNGADAIFGGWGDDSIFGDAGNDDLHGEGDNDDLYGGLDEDTLFGGLGNDALYGGTQNDRLRGSEGNDRLDGGADLDIADYTDAPDRVVVNLNVTTSQDTKGGGTDTLISIEGLDGSAFDDELLGRVDAPNTLFGNDGDDTLQGGTEPDTLYAGAGDDTIFDALGDDVIYGGTGADWLVMSSGGTGATVDLNLTTAQDTGGAGIDVIVGIEHLTGTRGDDSLTGSVLANILRGDDGNDTIDGRAGGDVLFGEAGNDVFIGGAGADLMDGGSGDRDTLDYSASGAGVTMGLDGQVGVGGDAAGDAAIGIENLVGSNFSDHLTGSSARNTISGGNRDDTILLLSGSDTGYGGDGDDTIEGGAGADAIFGGAGSDMADYASSTRGVNVFLTGAAPNTGGDAEGDVLSRIENLAGSDFDDVLLGAGGSNTLIGRDGSDVLSGEGGPDVLYGGAGFDALSGAEGGTGTADLLFGGADLDIAYYFTADSSQVVDFSDHTNPATNSGEHMLDTWDSIEGFYGANAHSNTIIGDGADNLFVGGNQADMLEGGGGSDILTGRGGTDLIYGGAGADYLSGDGGDDTVYGGAGGDTFYVLANSGVERIADYSEAEDGFLFYRAGATQWSDLTLTVSGDDVHITAAGGSFTVIVENATLADLDNSAGNFAFL